MKIKRYLSLFMAMLMLVMGLAACDKDGDGDGENEAKAPEYVDVIADGSSNYTIVVSKDASKGIQAMSTEFIDTINEKVSVKIKRITDNTDRHDPVTNEILIGVSGREESKAVFDTLPDIGYAIEYNNDKIVVVGTNDLMLEKALDVLVNKTFKIENGKVQIDKNTKVSYTCPAEEVIFLTDDEGKFKYKLVYASEASDAYTNMSNLRTTIKNKIGNIPALEMDIQSKANSDTYEILIGNTNRPESKAFYETLAYGTIGVKVSGNKILVGANIDEQLSDAVVMFVDIMNSAINGSYNEKYVIDADISTTKFAKVWMQEIPLMGVGTFKGAEELTPDISYKLEWTEITEQHYENYIAKLKHDGFTILEKGTVGDKKYTIAYNEVVDLQIYYLKTEGLFRIMMERD